MKTPDEIKTGLEHCSEDGCKDCPYEQDCTMTDGFSELARDARLYIRDLEGLVEDLQGAFSRMLAKTHLQLPLTLTETTGGDYCWLDLPCWREACPCDCVIVNKNTVRCKTIHTKFEFDTDSYGKTWRCWRDRPTQEEREAAVWEV